MDVIYERCAGLDIGKNEVTACVRTPGESGRRRQEIRTYPTFTTHLKARADWLTHEQVTQLEPVGRNSPRAVGQRPARSRLPATLDVPTRLPDPLERDEDSRAMEAFKIVAPEADSAIALLALEL